MSSQPPRCPTCQSAHAVPIVYGMPDWELGEAAERGEVVLGGCCVTGDDPHWHCKDCGRDFGRPSASPRGRGGKKC